MNCDPGLSMFFGNHSLVEIRRTRRDCYESLIFRLPKLRHSNPFVPDYSCGLNGSAQHLREGYSQGAQQLKVVGER